MYILKMDFVFIKESYDKHHITNFTIAQYLDIFYVRS